MSFTLIYCWVIAAIIALIECCMKKWQKGDGVVMIPFFCFKTVIYYLLFWFVDGVIRFWILDLSSRN